MVAVIDVWVRWRTYIIIVMKTRKDSNVQVGIFILIFLIFWYTWQYLADSVTVQRDYSLKFVIHF